MNDKETDMKNLTSILKSSFVWLFVALGFCVYASAATYYVDATGGNDTNSGTTTSAAWKTLGKVAATNLQPGDNVLLKRGAIWRERLMVPTSGTASASITFGAYGSGAAPIITGSDPLSAWTAAATNLYTASFATQPEVVTFDGIKGVRETSSSAVNAANEWFWTGGVLMVYSTSVPSNVEVSSRHHLVAVYGKTYVTIRDLQIQFAEDPIYLYDTNNVTIDNVVVRDCAGYAGVVVVSDIAGIGEYNTIQNCQIYNISGSTASMQTGANGDGVLLYEANCRYNAIRNNTVHDLGREGIVIYRGSYNTVSGNTVYRSAQSGIRIAEEVATGNVIEGNNSYQNCLKADDRFGIDLIRVGNDNIVRYNVVHEQNDTLADSSIPADPTNAGQKYGTGGIRFDGGNWEGHDHMESTGNKAYYNVVYGEGRGIESFNFSNIHILNNTVCNSRNFGIAVHSVFSVVATGNVVANNIVQNAGFALMYHYRTDNVVFDNNCYYSDTPASFIWKVDDNIAPCDLASWQSLSGQDLHALAADARFVDVAKQNFQLASDSPCVDAAANLDLSKDLAGTAVPQWSAPDIGAYEMTDTKPVTAEPATVTLATTVAGLTNSSSVAVTATFSAPVTGFTSQDITLTNATVTALSGSGASYTITVNPKATGSVSVYVPADIASTSEGASNLASNTVLFTYDNVAPTASMASTASSTTTTSPIPVTVTFSEDVFGFVSTDISLTNATLTGFSGSENAYSFSLIPKAAGTVSASIPAGAFTDAAGNPNASGASISRTFSPAKPSVTITSTVGSSTSTTPIPLTVTFSSSVTGFTSSDLTLTNCTIYSFSGSGKTYTVKVKPSPRKTIKVVLGVDKAFDANGQGNLASNTFSCSYTGWR